MWRNRIRYNVSQSVLTVYVCYNFTKPTIPGIDRQFYWMRKGDWISRLPVVNKNGRGTLTRISTIAKCGKRCWLFIVSLFSYTALPRNSGLLDRHMMYGKKSWISHGCWVYLDLSSTSQNWFSLMTQDGSRKIMRSGIFQRNSVTSRCANTSDWITRRNQWWSRALNIHAVRGRGELQ